MNTELPDIDHLPTPEVFELHKEYKLKYPITRGETKITHLKIEVPNGLQMMAMRKKEDEFEMLACLVSQCSKDIKLTENEVLALKYPDLKGLVEVCADFLL